MAGVLLVPFLVTGCAGRSGKEKPTDESGLELSGKMPDKLPDGLSWYNFSDDTGIFDYLSESIGEVFISDITYFDEQTWLFVCEKEPDLPVYHIMSFDTNSTPVNDFVIRNEFGDNISLNRMVSGDRLYMSAYDFSTQRDYLYPIDGNTGSISPDNRIDFAKNTSVNDAMSVFTFIGDDIALLEGGQTPCVELIDTENGTVKQKVSLDTLNRDFHVKYPEGIICSGTDKVVVWGSTSANYYFGQTRYCLIDLETGKISALDEADYIDIPIRNLSYCNGGLVTVTDGGVYLIDTDSSTCRMILSFNCTNCNRFMVNNSELKYADEEKLIFGYSHNYVGTWQSTNALCTFTKTDEYPAAGKNIITVASTEDLDYSIAEAIKIFNSGDNSSFILFDSRYKANGEIDYSNSDNAEVSAFNAHRSYASVSDRLVMDLMSGEGPDILITNGANEQLSKSEYFLDLSDFFNNESGVNQSDYFMNAIDASKFNGALYQLPIGFCVEGFMGTSDSFGGRNGLTFDEYLSMVKTVCNGQDPVYDHQLYYSRAEVAAGLFANSSEMFIKDGKIDVNNEAFRAILDYCKDLPSKGFYEGKDIDEEYEDLVSAMESMPVQPVVVYGFYEFEEFARKHDDVMICGYPSTDGRSAAITSNLAVSVSAHSSDGKACEEFLRVLLSEEVQSSLTSCIPINRKCAREIALEEIESYNSIIAGSSGKKFAHTGEALDPALADSYIEQVSQASTSGFVYHSIALIIYEKIPAYFEGQKSFEDVADTINDRAQKVLNERD